MAVCRPSHASGSLRSRDRIRLVAPPVALAAGLPMTPATGRTTKMRRPWLTPNLAWRAGAIVQPAPAQRDPRRANDPGALARRLRRLVQALAVSLPEPPPLYGIRRALYLLMRFRHANRFFASLETARGDALPTLTVIVIAKNEEAMIGRCLRSVGFADARIVLDSGSTDRTVETALACGARVETTADWPGFGPQKNRALALATTDWVLSLDADEWLDAEAAAAVRDALARGGADAYELPRRSRFCGRVVRHCGWSPDYVCRLFRRGRARFSDDLVHERLIVDGPVKRLSHPIDHDSIESWADAEDKIARYAEAAAQQMAARGRRGSYFSALLHGWGAFAKTLLLRTGVLDGTTGWQVAEYNRRYAEAKWRRLAELTRARKAT